MSLDNNELDKLLELASQKLDPKEDTKVSDVYIFILEKGIKFGETPITPTHVYETYTDWSSSPKSQTKFGREFKKYFGNTVRIRRGQPYYMLDASSFDMTEEAALERRAKLRDKFINDRFKQQDEENKKK